MSDSFDPYYTWLSIPPQEQPPNHYRLLGVALLESNPEVIESAADRQMTHVRSFQSGKHSAVSQKLLNELAAARLCLLAADKKLAYDRLLRSQLAPSASAAQPKPPFAPQLPTAAPARATPVQSIRTARPIASQPQPLARAAVEVGLGFDPLAAGSSPRRHQRKRAGRPSLTLAGVGLGALVALGLAWVVLGRNAQVPLANKPSTPAAVAGKRDGTDTSDRALNPERIAESAADTAALPGSDTVLFLSELTPRDFQVHGGLRWVRVALDGVLSEHGLCTHPSSANGSARVVYQLPTGLSNFQGSVGITEALPVDAAGSKTAVTFRIVGDGRTLWTSSPAQRRGLAEAFSVSIRGVKMLELFVDCPGDHYNAWAVWFDPCLTSELAQKGRAPRGPADGRDVFLSSLKSEDVSVWSGASLYSPVSLAGTPSPHGFFMHPTSATPSHAAFHLPAGSRKLLAQVGIDDSIPEPMADSDVTFRVVGDGRELWKSRPIRARGEPEPVEVDVTGVGKLELFVSCLRPERYCAAMWFEPRLTGGPPVAGKTQE